MYKIVRKTALELQTLDGNQVVKVAGILRRLKNVFKQLTDREFSGQVDKIREDSMDLQSVSAELNGKIDELLSAIKDGDVASYEEALDAVKDLSQELVKELKQLNTSARSGRKEVGKTKTPETLLNGGSDAPETEALPEAERPQAGEEQAPPSQDDGRYSRNAWKNRERRIAWMDKLREQRPEHDVPVSEYFKEGRKFESFQWLKDSTVVVSSGAKRQIIEKICAALLQNFSLDLASSEKIMNENWPEFETRLIAAIRNGAMFRYRASKPAGKVERRNLGEASFIVQAEKMELPGFDIALSAKFELNDLGLISPESERVIKVVGIETGKQLRVNLITTKKKHAERREKLLALALASQSVPYKIMPIDEVKLAQALAEGYRMAYGAYPSLETLGAAWSQACLERNPSLGLPNYNIGNIKATDEWVKSGRPYFVRSTKEVDKSGKEYTETGTKWRAYTSAEEGAAGYWRLLGGRFKEAVQWMAAGDPVSAAVVLGKKGYYTANVEKYSSTVGKMYQTFLKKIASKLPEIKSAPQPPPSSKKPDMTDNRFKGQLTRPAEQSDADRLLGVLFAMGPVEKMVTRSILERKLPNTDVVVSLGSLSAPFGMRLRFARAAATTLREVIDADVTIHSDGNKIELQCSALGSTYAVSSAVKALCDCVSVALTEKTQKVGSYSVAYQVHPSTLSKYAKLEV